MKEKSNNNPQLEQLLLELLDGDLDATQREQLDALLLDDPAARERYRELMAMHAMLDAEFSGSPTMDGEESLPSSPPTTNNKSMRYLTSLGWLTAGVLAASVVVLAFVLISGNRNDRIADGDSKQTPTEGAEPQKKALAVVTRVIDPEWMEDAEPVRPGQSLEKEGIKIASGIVQIEFANSACVTLEGPAQLRLDSVSECYVPSGKLTVFAPPAAANFTVRTPLSDVIDLGTEFGMVVEESGETDVHVLSGEVEVAIKESPNATGPRQKLSEAEAVIVRRGQKKLKSVPFNEETFEPIRAATLQRNQPLKIQFDCGNRSGVYKGTQSPAHATGEMNPHETNWNLVVGDQAGGFMLADGSVSSHRIEVDLGHGKKEIDWEADIDTRTGPQGVTHGVFDTALGRDAINPPPGSGNIGLRLRGLPKGKYRVYVIGRTSLDHANWGNYLVEKTHTATVDLGDITLSASPPLVMAPLKDRNAKKWVTGQTHIVTDVEVSDPDEYVTIITSYDRNNSPTPQGGRSVILGVQIVQVAD